MNKTYKHTGKSPTSKTQTHIIRVTKEHCNEMLTQRIYQGKRDS